MSIMSMMRQTVLKRLFAVVNNNSNNMQHQQQAIQVSQLGGPEVLELGSEVPIPTAGVNEIVVKNAYSDVNYIDTYHRSGLYKMQLPFIPGRDASGVVSQVGSDVAGKFKVGDRVAYVSPGTYAQFTATSADKVIKIPDSVDLKQAAASMLVGMTSLMLCKKVVQVKKDDWVLVHAAAGGVGQVLCQICKDLGATVVGTVSTQEKSEVAKQAGAHHTILYSTVDVAATIMSLTNNRGVDVVFDGVGKSTFDGSLNSLKSPSGYLVCYGNASGKPDLVDILRLGSRYLCRPNLGEFIKTREQFHELANDLMVNYIETKRLVINIHKTYPLAEAALSHADLESRGTTGKLVLEIPQ